ncbi:MAG: hypothetical protein ACJ72E_12775 [Marmoricola sp.]
MNKIQIAIGTVLGGAGLATAGVAHAARPAHHRFVLVAAAPTTSLLARPCDDCIVFSQPDGAHIGGTEYDAGAVSRAGKVVGHFALVSVGVTPFGGEGSPGELQLNASLSLPGGQLVGQGIEEPPLNGGTLAITGGTGRYANARGTVRYTDNDDGSTVLHVDLIG